MTFLIYPLVFIAGALFGILINELFIRLNGYDGTIKVIKDVERDKTVYSLELDEDAELLQYASKVVFKVDTSSSKSLDRT